MRATPSSWLAVAACTLVAAVTFTATPAGRVTLQDPASAPAPSLPDDPDAALFAQTCNKCHDGLRIFAVRRTSDEWEELIRKMIERGAQGTGKDFETVFAFLLRYYGNVYINEAPASEIARVVGLSAKDADAIVAYRAAQGPFADVEAVKKVPGIDVKMLDKSKDALTF